MKSYAIRTLVFSLFAALLVLSGCAYGKHIDKGDEYFQQGQYEQALTEYEAAHKLDPDEPEANQKIHQAQIELVGVYAERVDAALDASDLPGAVAAAATAYDRLPHNPAVGQIMDKVSARGDQLAATALEQQSWAYALSTYEMISNELPPQRTAFAQKAAEVRAEWTQQLKKRAATAEAEKQSGLAALYWAKAVQLSADDEAAGHSRTLQAELGDTYQYLIYLNGDSRDPGYQSVASQLAVPIPQNSLVIESERPAKSATLGASVLVKVSRPNFQTKSRTRTETTRYQSGTKQVQNPRYASAREDVTYEEGQLVKKQEDLSRYQKDVDDDRAWVAKEGPSPGTSTSAEQSLSRSQSSLDRARSAVDRQRRKLQRTRETLARTEQFVEEPVYRDLNYTITTKTRVATANVSITVEHPDGRKRIAFNTDLATSASDDSHRAYPQANIAEDPLRLPPDADLATLLHNGAADPVWTTITQSFAGWRDTLRAQAAQASSDPERANFYAIYVFTAPSSVDPDVLADLKELTGIPDADRVLKRP